MKKIFFGLFLLLGTFFYPQEIDWDAAEQRYLAKDYDSALAIYQTAAQTWISAHLEYNQGLLYFQKKQLGWAIWHFERASLLDPLNQNIQHNLQMAKKLQSDKFEKQDFSPSWQDILAALLPVTWLSAIATTLVGLIVLSLGASIAIQRIRKIGQLTAVAFTALWAIMSYLERAQIDYLQTAKYLIIVQNNASLYTEPAPNAEQIYTLHEGSKVKKIKENERYFYVETLSNTQGWIAKDRVAAIAFTQKEPTTPH